MKKLRLNFALIPTVLLLAGPTMLEQLMQTAVQYIDTAMVGSLGTSATAAVGSTTTINWLINGTVSALSIGFLSLIAKALGALDEKRARRVSAQTVWAVLVSGLFFTVLTLSLAKYVPVWMRIDEGLREMAATYFFILYMPMLPRAATIIFGTVLRAAGDTKTPMYIGIFVNLTNIILNFVLIYETRTVTVFERSFTLYGAGLGVIGAAVASAVAFTLGGLLITVFFLRHKVISPLGESFAPDTGILRPAMKIAFPNMLQRFGTSLGYVFFASMINSLGEISTAAHTIANTVESLFYIPAYGMQTAAATLAGNALGARDRQKMQDYTGIIILIEVILNVVSGGLLFIFAPAMMGIFNKEAAVITLGATVLRMVAVSEPFYGICIALEGMLQGVGNTKRPFVFNVIGMWGIRIVGTWLCITFFGGTLVSAWGCMILHNLVLFTMFLTYCTKKKNNPLYG